MVEKSIALLVSANPNVLMICGAVITALGLIISGVGGVLSSKKQNEIQEDLIKKTEENNELNQELANLVTGGESFCYLIVSRPRTGKTGRFTVLHEGRNHLYDVEGWVYDLDAPGDNYGYKHMKIGQLIASSDPNSVWKRVHHHQNLHSFSFGNGMTRSFNIQFIARNGAFDQVLRFKKINGEWLQAFKIERDGEYIFEEADDDFPRTEDGEIDW